MALIAQLSSTGSPVTGGGVGGVVMGVGIMVGVGVVVGTGVRVGGGEVGIAVGLLVGLGAGVFVGTKMIVGVGVGRLTGTSQQKNLAPQGAYPVPKTKHSSVSPSGKQ